MRLIVDVRERDLIEILGDRCEVAQLDVGDVHFVPSGDTPLRGGTPALIIERKTWGDLGASIKDGRYREQKARLLEAGAGGAKLMYVFERGKVRGRLPLETCCVNTMLRDGIFVHKTAGVQETADFILKIVEKWGEIPRDYSSSLTVRKGAKMDPALCYRLQLATVPGFSVKMASAIAEVYPTMGELLDALRSGASVTDIKVGGRRIGMVRAKRLVEFMIPSAVSASCPGEGQS